MTPVSDRNAELLVELMHENSHDWRALDFWDFALMLRPDWPPDRRRRFLEDLFAAIGELKDQTEIAAEQGDNDFSRAYRDGLTHDIATFQAELCAPTGAVA